MDFRYCDILCRHHRPQRYAGSTENAGVDIEAAYRRGCTLQQDNDLTLMLQLGEGNLPPDGRTFYPVAPKPLRIVTRAFATFPKYVWAKNAEEKFQIFLLVFLIWRPENGHPTVKT